MTSSKTAGPGPALLKVRGEPGDALNVEVVGGLIQHDHVPVVDQQRRQLHPAALPARQRVDGGVERDVAHQTGDHVARPGIAGPLVIRPLADQGPAHGAVRIERVGLV